jgi:hypothetical protein
MRNCLKDVSVVEPVDVLQTSLFKSLTLSLSSALSRLLAFRLSEAIHESRMTPWTVTRACHGAVLTCETVCPFSLFVHTCGMT